MRRLSTFGGYSELTDKHIQILRDFIDECASYSTYMPSKINKCSINYVDLLVKNMQQKNIMGLISVISEKLDTQQKCKTELDRVMYEGYDGFKDIDWKGREAEKELKEQEIKRRRAALDSLIAQNADNTQYIE